MYIHINKFSVLSDICANCNLSSCCCVYNEMCSNDCDYMDTAYDPEHQSTGTYTQRSENSHISVSMDTSHTFSTAITCLNDVMVDNFMRSSHTELEHNVSSKSWISNDSFLNSNHAIPPLSEGTISTNEQSLNGPSVSLARFLKMQRMPKIEQIILV